MTSVRKMVAQQVIIPAMQAGFMACLGAAGGHYVSLWWGWPADVTIPAGALLLGGYWAAKRMDKNARFPSVAGRALSRLSRVFATTTSLPAHFEGVEGINTTILLKSSNDEQGEWFRLAGVDPRKMRRIAFHVCFMGGRVSHPYLDYKTGLLTRPKVTNLQIALVDNKLAVRRGTARNSGVSLNEKGAEVLLSLARLYRPTPFERRIAIPYLKRWNVANIHTAHMKYAGGGIYDD